MIKISVENVETMDPGALSRIAGLFQAISEYVQGVAVGQQEEIARKVHTAQMYESAQKAEAAKAGAPQFDHMLAEQPAAVIPVPPGMELPSQEEDEDVPDFPFLTNAAGIIAGIDVDSRNLPWDGRIHASSRAKVNDGSWRQKRGVAPELVATVEHELRQMMGMAPLSVATAPVADVPVPTPPVIEVPTPPFAINAAPPAVPINGGAPLITTGVGVAATASPSKMFPTLMKGITAGYAAKTLTQEMINAAVQASGVPALPMLMLREDLIPGVASQLGIAL